MVISANPKGLHLVRYGEFLAFEIAYIELLNARGEAEDRGLPASGLPVPLSRFHDFGIEDSILLWMLYQAHIEHFQNLPGPDTGPATLVSVTSLAMLPTSCFALTTAGAAFADRFLADVFAPEPPIRAAARRELPSGRPVPCYDMHERVWTWGPYVLKHFRQPALNQELILCTAEELDWLDWFDDPLPRRSGLNPKTRLHETIKDLNRRQTPYLVHFQGDGTGRRIGWIYR